MPPPTCPQANLIEAIPQVKFILPRCISLTTKTNHNNQYLHSLWGQLDKLQRKMSNIFCSRPSYEHIVLPRWCLSPRVFFHIQYRIMFRQCGRTVSPRRNTGLVCISPSFKGRFTGMSSLEIRLLKWMFNVSPSVSEHMSPSQEHWSVGSFQVACVGTISELLCCRDHSHFSSESA